MKTLQWTLWSCTECGSSWFEDANACHVDRCLVCAAELDHLSAVSVVDVEPMSGFYVESTTSGAGAQRRRQIFIRPRSWD